MFWNPSHSNGKHLKSHPAAALPIQDISGAGSGDSGGPLFVNDTEMYTGKVVCTPDYHGLRGRNAPDGNTAPNTAGFRVGGLAG